jgi:hypothetical protein
MDFAFFEQMTPEEAETFFLSFVKVEGAAVEALVVDANEAGRNRQDLWIDFFR